MHASSSLHLAFGWLVLSGDGKKKIKKLVCFLLKIESLSVKEVTESCPSLQTPCQIQLKLASISEPGKRLQYITNKQTNILSVVTNIMINTSAAYNPTLQQTLTPMR